MTDTLLFLGSEIYRNSRYGPHHPLGIARVSTVIDLCRALGWLGVGQYRVSPCAKPKALHLYHDPAYVAALLKAERTQHVDARTRARFGLDTASNPIFPEVYRRPATGAGGALLAAELLSRGGVVFHPAGGTHHGLRARASGFCYLNDPVLAILALLAQGLDRIAYVDIDAHHGDGVEIAFAGDPRVLMISVHEEKRWPFTGAVSEDARGNAFNLPVPRGYNDTQAEAVLQELIVPKVAAFAPQALILLCGADAVAEDPLSRLMLSNNAHWAVLDALRSLSPRLLVLGGGGYNPWAVGRLWSGLWAGLAGHDIPDSLPEAARQVLCGLTWHRLRGDEPPIEWTSTLRDAPRPGPMDPDLRARLTLLRRRPLP